jgi:hypothetical protein
MAWRKWLVRGLVFSVMGGLALAGFLYQHWTNPAAVRRQVLDKLAGQFSGAWVSVESAHIRLLGGISVRELRVGRQDDADQTDLAHVPAALFYPDKEQVVNGRFTLRKVELYHPVLRLRRNRDGRWNVVGLLAPPRTDEFLPIMEVQQGTVVLEDRFAGSELPALEIAEVNLTLINSPLTTIRFEGTGKSSLIGSLHINGAVQRVSGDVTFSIQATGISLANQLNQRLAAYCPRLAEETRHLEGTANFQADIGFSPSAAQPWTYDVHGELAGGKFHHPKIPRPLQDLQAKIRCVDGRVELDSLSARCDQAEVTLQGKAWNCRDEPDCEGTLTVRHLPVSPEIFAHLPASLQKINADYAPTGPVTLTVQGRRVGGQWQERCVIHPEDLTASFVGFPYALEHISGTVEMEIDTAGHREETHIDLSGLAGSQRVSIKGDVSGDGPQKAVALRIAGDNIPLDQKLMAALSPAHQRLAATFHPTGQADFVANFQRAQGSADLAKRFLIRFHHAAINYEVFPYPLEEVSGTLDILPTHWEFHDFHGTHKGGRVQAAGRFHQDAGGGHLLVQLQGDAVLLDAELQAACQEPELQHAWTALAPSGRIKFRAQVERQGDARPEIDVGIMPLGCAIKPSFFPYQFDELSGYVHYARRWLYLENLTARHGTAVVKVDKGQLYAKPEGGIWADLTNLQAFHLVPDDDLLPALPPVLRQACDGLRLHDPFDLTTHLTLAASCAPGSSPDIYWDAKIELHDAELTTGVPLSHVSGAVACQGRCNGRQLDRIVGNLAVDSATLYKQPFHDIKGAFEIKNDAPNVLVIPGLHAGIFGGEIYGPLRIEFGTTTQYEMNLTASQIQLEEFGRHNLGRESEIKGLATAHVNLKGQGPELNQLTGQGTIDVPNGARLLSLPPFLDLLKFLAIRLPDGTAFEEAHGLFKIHGKRLAIDRLELFGNSISLRGQGEMNLDGTDINVDLYAVWAARITQMLPPFIKELPHDVSKYLLRIQMRGQFGDVHFTKEPVPVLVEPLKSLLERMSGRTNSATKTRPENSGTSEPASQVWPWFLPKLKGSAPARDQ